MLHRATAALGTCLTLAGCLALAACRATPPAQVSTPYGVARAATPQEAAVLAQLLEDLGPQVRAMLPDSLDRPTEVWLDDFGRYAALADRPGVVGLTSLGSGQIRIRDDRLGRDADYVLVHELVHALLGESWETLPAIMKEGLCDAIAARLVPRAAARVSAIRLFDASFGSPNMALELNYHDPGLQDRQSLTIPLAAASRSNPLEALELPGRGIHLHDAFDDENALYGYGWLVTERIVARHGFEGLQRLCVEAAEEGLSIVPRDRLLEAAELDNLPSTWRKALLERIDDQMLLAQCDHVAAQLGDYLVSRFRYQYPERDGEDWLLGSLPTIGWAGTDVRVPVAAADRLVDELLARWARAGASPLRPGDGWWLHDGEGVHLTSVMEPTEAEPWYTIHRLGMPRAQAQPVLQDVGSLLPVSSIDTRVEALLQIGRDDRGVWVRSLHPEPLAAFRVAVDGFVAADLEQGLNVVLERDAQGWWRATSRLPGDLELEGLVLYHERANVIISQRAGGGPGARDQHFPLWVPYAP